MLSYKELSEVRRGHSSIFLRRQLAGYTLRVSELLDTMEDIKQNKLQKKLVSEANAKGAFLVLHDRIDAHSASRTRQDHQIDGRFDHVRQGADRLADWRGPRQVDELQDCARRASACRRTERMARWCDSNGS